MFVHQMPPILDRLGSGLCLGSSVVAGGLAFYFLYTFLFQETSGGQGGREKTCPGAVGWETGKAEMGRCLQMFADVEIEPFRHLWSLQLVFPSRTRI